MSSDLLLDRNTFLARFGSSDPRQRCLLRLHALVAVDEARVRDSGLEWLEDLVDWLFERGEVPGRTEGQRTEAARAELLLTASEEIPAFRERLRATVTRVLVGASSTLLFADLGIPTHSGFWRELTDRLERAVLPPPPVGRDTSRLLARLFDSERKVQWLLTQPEDSRRRLLAAVGLDDDTARRTFEPGLKEAALLLGARISMQGLSDDLRRRAPETAVATSPFLELPGQVQALLDGALPLARLLATVERGRELLRRAEATLDETGISVDLVFRLELLTALLTRLAQVATLLAGQEDARAQARAQLERDLLVGTVADRSLGTLLQSSTRLLARRVVERAGASGEHYISRTRQEQQAMLDAAAGGGAVTAFMVFTKFYVGWAQLPPFFDALAVGLNYAWGFVLMQFLHFALATKQPSMTAATLAGAIEAQHGEERPDLEPLVELVARAMRTQLTALVGNVFVVVPFAMFVAIVFELALGRQPLDAATAEKVIRVHHPLASVTIFSAVMTGVWLWAASLLAGAVENWFVLRELPGAIASNRLLRRTFGASRATRAARFMTEQVSGLGGNIGFGMMLGFMPMLFVLVGLPLEVRHVTFVTGQLVYAAMATGPAVFARSDFLAALLSVPLVGLINFGVSFAFAIVVALRARGLGVRSQVALLRATLRRFARDPRPFFLAPRDAPAPAPAPPP